MSEIEDKLKRVKQIHDEKKKSGKNIDVTDAYGDLKKTEERILREQLDEQKREIQDNKYYDTWIDTVLKINPNAKARTTPADQVCGTYIKGDEARIIALSVAAILLSDIS